MSNANVLKGNECNKKYAFMRDITCFYATRFYVACDIIKSIHGVAFCIEQEESDEWKGE